MFDPNQKDVLIDALTNRHLKRKHIVIGSLSERQHSEFNIFRSARSWEPRTSNLIIIGKSDIAHLLTRIDKDGLTPTEVVSIIEHALSDNSVVSRGDHSRPVLTNLEFMHIDGNQFAAKAIFLDGNNMPHPRLWGVIPKGWKGRK